MQELTETIDGVEYTAYYEEVGDSVIIQLPGRDSLELPLLGASARHIARTHFNSFIGRKLLNASKKT